MYRPDDDILVIGGGPAGATFAALAAKEGFRVSLIEKDAFPRDRIGESITVDCAKRLLRLGLPSPLEKTPLPWRIASMKVSYEKSGNYRAYFPEELQHFLVRRAHFDQSLLLAAKERGVRVLFQPVRALKIENNRVEGVLLADGTSLRAKRLVVAAVGRDTGLLRKAGVRYQKDSRLSIFGARAFFRLDWQIPKNTIDVVINNRDIAVVTPLDDGKICAVYFLLSQQKKAQTSGSKQEVFFSLLDNFPSLTEKLQKDQMEGSIEFQSPLALYATGIKPQKLALLGNALGYSDPLLSHGVDYAIGHAVILCNLLKKSTFDRDLRRYHRAAKKMIWLDIALHRAAYEVLWRESLYRRMIPNESFVSGIRLGEGVLNFLWKLAGLTR